MDELRFDRWQFDNRRSRPVSAASGIDWSDYFRSMSMDDAPQLEGKLKWIPKFVHNNGQFRQVLMARARTYAHVSNPWGCPDGRSWQDLEVACTKLALGITYSRNCNDFQRNLIDRHKAAVQKAGGYLALQAAVAFHYWRRAQSSVAVAEILGISPQAVRQAASKLLDVARELGIEPPSEHWSAGKKRAPQRRVFPKYTRWKVINPAYIEGVHCWECKIKLIDKATNKWRCAGCLQLERARDRVHQAAHRARKKLLRFNKPVNPRKPAI